VLCPVGIKRPGFAAGIGNWAPSHFSTFEPGHGPAVDDRRGWTPDIVARLAGGVASGDPLSLETEMPCRTGEVAYTNMRFRELTRWYRPSRCNKMLECGIGVRAMAREDWLRQTLCGYRIGNTPREGTLWRRIIGACRALGFQRHPFGMRHRARSDNQTSTSAWSKVRHHAFICRFFLREKTNRPEPRSIRGLEIGDRVGRAALFMRHREHAPPTKRTKAGALRNFVPRRRAGTIWGPPSPSSPASLFCS